MPAIFFSSLFLLLGAHGWIDPILAAWLVPLVLLLFPFLGIPTLSTALSDATLA